MFSDRGKIQWKNWNQYMADLVCRCAKAAIHKAGTASFAVEFYGKISIVQMQVLGVLVYWTSWDCP